MCLKAFAFLVFTDDVKAGDALGVAEPIGLILSFWRPLKPAPDAHVTSPDNRPRKDPACVSI